MAYVNDDDRIRKFLHGSNAVEVPVELFALTGENSNLFLFELVVFTVDDGVDILHFFDGFLDGGIVCERSAHPSFHHIIHSGGFRSFTHNLLRLSFRSDKENLAAFHDTALQEIAGVGDLMNGLGNVDDGDTVFGTVDIIFHLGVPAFCLMSEMTSCLEKIFYCESHDRPPFLLFRRFRTDFIPVLSPARHLYCSGVMCAPGWLMGKATHGEARTRTLKRVIKIA